LSTKLGFTKKISPNIYNENCKKGGKGGNLERKEEKEEIFCKKEEKEDQSQARNKLFSYWLLHSSIK
jgi:hypothetical protein